MSAFDDTTLPECCLEVNTLSGSHIAVCVSVSAEFECQAEVRKLGSRIRQQCLGGGLSQQKLKDLAKDTIDQHDDGVWAGWVFHSVIVDGEGSANPEPVFITIDANKREVSFGESKKRPDIVHKFMDMEWDCN